MEEEALSEPTATTQNEPVNTTQNESAAANQNKENQEKESHFLLPIPEGFAKPLKTQSLRWRNFYRSQEKEKGGGNRYNAKCGFCLYDVDGRPERLHNHVLKCKYWPIVEKTTYLQDVSKENAEGEQVQRKRPREDDAQQSKSKQQSIFSWVSKPMPLQKVNEVNDLLLKAIIYGGISFTIGNNPFFIQYSQALCSSYMVPSRNMLSGCILTEMYSKHLQRKLSNLPTLTDFTICFDGWTDVSSNSIYAFMVLKEEYDDMVDVVDLSDIRHTAINLKEQLLSNLMRNGAAVGNAIACITDSPSTMIKLRNDLKDSNPNILSIRCCLHGFNLLVKDVVGYSLVVDVCKRNQKLVNYFTSSHIWRKALTKWQQEQKIPHFLSTFCETRWYSLSRVCLGVSTYEEGFRYCLELSKKSDYPSITNMEVRNIILNRHHFADNATLVEALKPIVDVIGKLEKRTSTLADVLYSFIMVYHNVKNANYGIRGLQEHVRCAIGKRVKEFEDPIYFIALFLHPAFKKMAMYRKMKGEAIIIEALEIAKVWGFSYRESGLLFKELINYQNGDAPFDDLKESKDSSARHFWEKFYGASPLLRRFAMKVFAIVPHSGPCERLFSILGLIKKKTRNRLEVDNLNMIAQIKCDLGREVFAKKKFSEAITDNNRPIDGLSMGDFDMSNEEDMENDILDEVVEEINFPNQGELQIMEKFFDFEAFERDNAVIEEMNMVNPSASESAKEWSIADIIQNFS